MRMFHHDRHRLHDTEIGTGERTVVLVPGLWTTQRIYEPLARDLAQRGHQVLGIELLGHGGRWAPTSRWRPRPGADPRPPRRPDPPVRRRDALAAQLPGARVVVARNAMELRREPQRLTGEIATFLDAAWATRNGDG